MKWSPSSLRLALVATALSCVIAGATALLLLKERRDVTGSFRSGVVTLRNYAGRMTERWINAIDKALVETQAEALAAQTASRDARPRRAALALRGKAIADALARRRDTLADVTDLLLIDPDGQIANASRPVPPSRTDATASEIYRHFRDSDDKALFVSRPAMDALSGEPVIFLARRIDGEDGGWLGIAVATVTLRNLKAFYASIMPRTRSVSLARSDGIMLARVPGDDSVIDRKIPDESPWYALAAGGAGGGTFEGRGEFGAEPIIASVRRLPGLPLVIEAAVSRDLALLRWTRQEPWFLVGGLSAIAVVLLLLRVIETHSHRLERSEESLARRNADLELTRMHLNITLANVSHGVTFFDGWQRLIVCNRRFAELFKLPDIAMRPGISLAEITTFANAAGCAMVTPDAFPPFDLTETGYGEPVHIIAELQDGRTISMRRQPMPDGGWVGTQEDITEQRRQEQHTAFLAQHDVLTGLANRALFGQRLAAALAGTARGGACAVLFLDLDRFKPVNDTLGHQVGDALLRSVANRLLGCVRAVDTVARLGGDEFAILQDGLSGPDDVAHLAERIISVISEPYSIQGHDVSIGTSIGMALAPADGATAEAVIRAADLALYRSKFEGRGTFRFFEPGMDATAQDRLRLEQELRDAVARDEFQLYYQPIVDLRSGAVQAFEALIRWNHPAHGLLGPDQFLTTTEDSGLIVAIGEWALEQACAAAREWPSEIRVVLNVSDAQFHRGDVSDVVGRVLAATGLPGSRLELDINETSLLRHADKTMAMLHRLRDLGVGIVLDDFGVGPSSLSGLRQFPFDKVKVDASCIRDIGTTPEILFTVRAILRLCADLGIRTVVEGVETPEQRDLLLREHCDQAQGFLFGRPRPAEQIFERTDEGGVTYLAAAAAAREFARQSSRVAA